MHYRKTLIVTLTSASLIAWPASLLQAQSSYMPSSPQAQSPGMTTLSGSQKVEFNKLPGPVQAAIRSQAGQSSVSSVNRGTWNGEAYQAAFEKNGKMVQLQVAADGTILNENPNHAIKTHLSGTKAVTYEELPAPVQATLSQQAGTQTFSSLHQGTWSEPVYQASLKNGRQILVGQDGSLLQRGRGTLNEASGAATSGTRAFKDIPWTVQKPMLDHSGWASIPEVNQSTLPDGRTTYTGIYQKQGKNYKIVVDQNGNVISDQQTR